jgi:thiosulfate dehydrogenase
MRTRHRLATTLPLLLAAACAREKSAASQPPPAPTAVHLEQAQVRLGSAVFQRTQEYTQALGGNALACTNCHLDGGKQVGALSLVGVSKKYPMPGPAGRAYTLEDRIVRCFRHSLAGKAPDPASPEAKSLVAYLTWLSDGLPSGPLPAGLRPMAIAPKNIVPIGQLDAGQGRQKFDRYCSGCHGLDGQGYRERRTPLPFDYVPPVWGPRSYDDAAGLARVYMLAGFVRHAMPRDKPGEITDREAQEIAAFIDGQPRPASGDVRAWDGTAPVDAAYDTKQYPRNPFYIPLDP